MFSLSSENDSEAEEELKEAIKHKKAEIITESQLDLLSTKTNMPRSESSSLTSSDDDELDSLSSSDSQSSTGSSTLSSSSSNASPKNKEMIEFSPAMDESKTDRDLLGFSLSEDEDEDDEPSKNESTVNKSLKEGEEDESALVNISDICREVEMSTQDG